MREPRRPDSAQKKLIKDAGLDPGKWSVSYDNASYLHLVDKGFEQRERIIIDKATGEAMREKEPWSRPKQTRA